MKIIKKDEIADSGAGGITLPLVGMTIKEKGTHNVP